MERGSTFLETGGTWRNFKMENVLPRVRQPSPRAFLHSQHDGLRMTGARGRALLDWELFSRGQMNSPISDNNDSFPCITQGAQTRAKSTCRRKEFASDNLPSESGPHTSGRQTGQSVTPILRSGRIGSLADAKPRYPKHRFPRSVRTTT